MLLGCIVWSIDLVLAKNIETIGRQYANCVRSNPGQERIDCTPTQLVLFLWQISDRSSVLCCVPTRRRMKWPNCFVWPMWWIYAFSPSSASSNFFFTWDGLRWPNLSTRCIHDDGGMVHSALLQLLSISFNFIFTWDGLRGTESFVCFVRYGGFVHSPFF